MGVKVNFYEGQGWLKVVEIGGGGGGGGIESTRKGNVGCASRAFLT